MPGVHNSLQADCGPACGSCWTWTVAVGAVPLRARR